MASLAATINIEEFIYDVKDRPAIWDRSYHINKQSLEAIWRELSRKHHVSTTALKAKWKGLRDNFRVEFKRIPRNSNGDFLIDPIDHSTKWSHYKSLLFLTEHMRSRQPKQEFYEQEYQDTNSSEYGLTYLSDGLIQIPDDDDEVDYCRKPSYIEVDMDMLKVPSGAAATLVEPVLESECNTSVKRFSINEMESYEEPDQSSSNENESMVEDEQSSDDDYHFLMSLHPYLMELNLSQKMRVRMKIQKLIFKELFKDEMEN